MHLNPIRSLLAFISLALIPGVLSAQFGPPPAMPLNETSWAAVLKPAPESPYITAKGCAWFTLDPEKKWLRYRIETNVPTANVVYLRTAIPYFVPPYGSGTPLATLSGTNGVFQGTLAPIPSGILSQLLSTGSSYVLVVAVHTPESPTLPAMFGYADLETRRHASAAFALGDSIGVADFEFHDPEGLVTYRIPALIDEPPQTVIEIRENFINGGTPSLVKVLPAGIGTGTIAPGILNLGKLLWGRYELHIHQSIGVLIKATILRRPDQLVARATGAQVYPPTSTTYTGFGTFTFDEVTRRMKYSVTYSAGAYAANVTINTASGDLVETLSTSGPGPWTGTTGPLSYDEKDALFNGGLFLTISPYYNPTGLTVRGRIEQNGRSFGWPSPTSGFFEPHELRISQASVPTVGGNWTVRLTGGLPDSIVWLYVGDDTNFYAYGNSGGVFWILYDNYYMAATDSDGAAEVTIPVPSTPALKGTPVFAQWVATESGAPYPGYVFSNALYSVYQ